MAQKKKAVTTSKASAKANTAKPKAAPAAKAKVAAAQVKLSKAAVKAKVAPAKAKPVAAKAPAAPAKAVKKPAAAKVAAKKPVAAVKKAVVAAAKTAPAPASVSAPRTVPAAVARKALNQRIAAPAGGAATKPAAKAATKPAVSAEPKKPVNQRHGFKANEYVVYPAHGVGRIVGIEEQEIAGMALELFVITFDKEKLTLRVPTGKLESVGMRKLADEALVKKALDILKGRARIKRTMWSRRAQEYIAKINSGDLISIAEVVRDLYRSEAQPEQSYSERQLYEDALDRMSREIAAVEKLDDRGAVQRITDILSKSAKSRRAEAEAEAVDEAAA